MKKSVPHLLIDPKVAAGFGHEINDCAVRALSSAFSIPYKQAHTMLQDRGRQVGKGTRTSIIHDIIKNGINGKVGHRIGNIGRSVRGSTGRHEITIGVFCRHFSKGRYFCFIRGHVFAVIDGVVVDSFQNRPGRRICAAYEIR